MNDEGVVVTVTCSVCGEFLGGEDTERTSDHTVIVERDHYQEHHRCGRRTG